MMPPGPPPLAPARPLLPANGERVLLPGQSPDGEYVLSVLVKRSYRIVPGGTCRRAASRVTSS